MSNVAKLAHARELKMAEEIVTDESVAQDGELDYHAVKESLHDNRQAGITYSPERVLSLVVSLARIKRIPVNKHNRR